MLVTDTGRALDSAGALVSDPLPVEERADGFVAESAASDVVIPSDPADAVSIEGANGQDIGIDLPDVPGLSEGVLDDPGAVVFEGENVPFSIASQATPDGAQLLVVIEAAGAAPRRTHGKGDRTPGVSSAAPGGG